MPVDGKSYHLALGKAGEDFAAAWFSAHGFTLLARNWRHGHLELDLVCQEVSEIVFVEVKTRRSSVCGGGPGAMTAIKRRRLEKAAQYWLVSHNLWQHPCRFDVVCLYGHPDNFRMEHYRNAFLPAMGCGHANWQPW